MLCVNQSLLLIRHSGLETVAVHDMFRANTADSNVICDSGDQFYFVDAGTRYSQLICGHFWLRGAFRLSHGPHKSTCHAVAESFTICLCSRFRNVKREAHVKRDKLPC